jgi:UPF0716 protein FxsA
VRLVPVVLLAAFLAVPLIELYVILRVGDYLGVLPTIALLVVASVAGTWLVRREGSRAWRAVKAGLAEGVLPARPAADGLLILLGGALLLTPGFATDVAGLLLVAPPTRTLARQALVRVLAARLGLPAGLLPYTRIVDGQVPRRRRRGRPGRG